MCSVRSRGTTRRSWFRARGETRYKSVRVGNKIARRVSYLLHYHWVKGHFYVLENPLSSLLWQYRCIRKRLQQHRAVRVVINLGNIGASTQKPVPCLQIGGSGRDWKENMVRRAGSTA